MNHNDNWNNWDMVYLMNNNHIWRLLAAVVILIAGLWVAKAVGGAIAKGLSRTNVDRHGETYFKSKSSLSRIAGQVIKYFLYLITILVVLELMSFTSILNPFVGLIGSITSFIPYLLAAALLAAVAHILGTLLKSLLVRMLDSETVRKHSPVLNQYKETLGTVLYALIILLFAPSILQALHIDAVSRPVGAIVNLIISYLPLLVSAAILVVIGHLIAKFVANLAQTLAASMNLQRWTGPEVNAPSIIRSLVYFLILFPIIVQALNILQIQSIQQPAEGILNLIMSWIPRVAVAAFLIYLGYIIAKIARNFALTLLSPMKLDQKTYGLATMFNRKKTMLDAQGNPLGGGITPVLDTTGDTLGARTTWPVTRWIANLIGILVFGFFLVEGTNILGLEFISATVASIMALLPRLVLVALIVLAGIVLARMAAGMVSDSNPLKSFIQPLIIVLAVVIGLTEIGLASIIITSGFMIVLGALAVTFIISVGIGSIPAVKKYWDKKQSRGSQM
ncbi:mechanosensitive ion channel [Paenibacillus gansuensis]|uniref:Mechanosensitive ion channel n=1 Tax=Paenibacillus gansuensis TaxID=306542 RepID=A0ABW5PEP0_9BACL